MVEVQLKAYKEMLKAAIILHNYIMKDVSNVALEFKKLEQVYKRATDERGVPAELKPIRKHGFCTGQKTKDVRSNLCQYFNTVGAIPNQRASAGIVESDSDNDSETPSDIE